MKRSYFNPNWLALLLGIAAVAGMAVAATTYFNIQRKTHTETAFSATLDRLYADQELSAALKQIHDGKVEAAAERMDFLLCDHVLLTDAELPSADAQTQRYAEQAFQRIAQLRPKRGAGSAAGSARGGGSDQAAAEKILNFALACAGKAQAK